MIDFGDSWSLPISTNWTETAVCSEGYTAPEVVCGTAMSFAADVFSLGKVINFLCQDGPTLKPKLKFLEGLIQGMTETRHTKYRLTLATAKDTFEVALASQKIKLNHK